MHFGVTATLLQLYVDLKGGSRSLGLFKQQESTHGIYMPLSELTLRWRSRLCWPLNTLASYVSFPKSDGRWAMHCDKFLEFSRPFLNG